MLSFVFMCSNAFAMFGINSWDDDPPPADGIGLDLTAIAFLAIIVLASIRFGAAMLFIWSLVLPGGMMIYYAYRYDFILFYPIGAGLCWWGLKMIVAARREEREKYKS